MKPIRSVLSIALLVIPLLAQTPLIDRQLFFGDPEISASQISPDGKFIAFLKPYQATRNIWVKAADEPFTAGSMFLFLRYLVKNGPLSNADLGNLRQYWLVLGLRGGVSAPKNCVQVWSVALGFPITNYPGTPADI